MSIEEKIKEIEKFTGLGFDYSICRLGYSCGSVGYLFKNKIINQSTYDKLISIKNTNFYLHFQEKHKLNSQSILKVNLIYNIIKNHLKNKNEAVHN